MKKSPCKYLHRTKVMDLHDFNSGMLLADFLLNEMRPEDWADLDSAAQLMNQAIRFKIVHIFVCLSMQPLGC